MILKSGDAFICDPVEENDQFIKVKKKLESRFRNHQRFLQSYNV